MGERLKKVIKSSLVSVVHRDRWCEVAAGVCVITVRGGKQSNGKKGTQKGQTFAEKKEKKTIGS